MFIDVFVIGDEYVAAGCRIVGDRGCSEPGVWRSRDGLAWAPDLPVALDSSLSGGSVSAVATSRAGLVAAGNVTVGEVTRAAVWVRTSDQWSAGGLPESENAAIGTLHPRGGGLVALGFGAFTEAAGFEAWSSPDGVAWQAARTPSSEGFPVDLIEVGDNLLAWGGSCNYCIAPSAWWASLDGGAWDEIQPPRGLEQATISSLGRLGDGYVAFGSVGGGGDIQARIAMWTATQDFDPWRPADPPSDAVEDSVRAHLEVRGGLVAAGTRSGEAGLSGIVWTRAPGTTTWVEDLAAPGLDAVALLPHPEPGRIVLIGRTATGTGDRVDIWTRRLDWEP